MAGRREPDKHRKSEAIYKIETALEDMSKAIEEVKRATSELMEPSNDGPTERKVV